MCVSACFLWRWGKQPHAGEGGGCTENTVQCTKYLIWKINGYALGLHISWVSVSKIPIRLYSHCPPIQIMAKHKSRRLQTEPLRVSKQAWAKADSWEKQIFQNFYICYLKKLLLFIKMVYYSTMLCDADCRLIQLVFIVSWLQAFLVGFIQSCSLFISALGLHSVL